MTIPSFPSDARNTIQEIVNNIGRNVTFFFPTAYSGCSLCSLDPVSNTSTDSFCTLCSGVYWIPTYSGYNVTAKVTWGKSEYLGWVPGGQVYYGDCTLTVMHSAETERIIFSSQYVDVDHRVMDLDDIILRGVPQYNRILVVLKEREKG